MEANVCDVNNLDADVLLPPRKRLLAGLKKQNSDVNSYTPISQSTARSEFDARLNNLLLRCHLSKPCLSKEEIIETSRLAALEAAKAAKAARATAEEKAANAARAVAAAKSALELVTNIRDRQSQKKNKTKKHGNPGTDEELARQLHTAINSSPRISKGSSASQTKSHKHKRLKTSPCSESAKVSSDGVTSSEGVLRLDLNVSKFNNVDHPETGNVKMLQFGRDNSSKMESVEEEVGINTMESTREFMGRKKGRLKQKKIPLSICSFKDQANPKEEQTSKSLSPNEESINKPLFPVERTTMWNCQAFKVPSCVKQNKAVQS